MSLTSAFAFLTSLVLSFVLTWTVRNFATKYKWASPSASQRDVHRRPIPRLGGVAIVLASYVTVLIALGFAKLTGYGANSPWSTLVHLLVPGAFIFFVGLVDDLRTLGPYEKFAGQAVGACMLWIAGLRIVHLPILFGSGELHYIVSLGATIIWVLWITNAFNLIDGVDGLAAGSALLSTLVIFVVSVFTKNYMSSFETAVLAGAILGFLRFNLNPATIFLGDCGSLSIGFTLSAIALQNGEKSSTMIAVAIPIVAFGLPMLETALSVARRFVGGRPLFAPDREHIHHKLLDLGFSQRQVVVILYGVTAFCGALSLLLLQPGARSVLTVLFVLAVGISIGVQKLGYREWDELARVAHRTLEQKDVIINNLAFRRVTRDLQSQCDFSAIECELVRTLTNNEFDGCELALDATQFEGHGRRLVPERSLGEDVFWAWHKPSDSSAKNESGKPAWSMSFALIDRSGINRGTLLLYRKQTERPLMVDINVITSCGFSTALADALGRAMAANAIPATLSATTPI